MPTLSEANKVVLRNWTETWNMTHDREAFYAAFAEKCAFPSLAAFGLEPTLAGYRQLFDTFLDAFPDICMTIEEQVAEGDKVVCRVTEQGTHTGSWQGIPATNRRVEFSEFVVYRFAESKIVEWRYYPDMLSLLQQVGALPA